ncbi:polypeptide N-acetylgalactosaminyltransferase 4-like [Rhincodon typus]|uniref:polypeptide N-acetylgalactosaminyltransferase 4-like n=1 Tax=Rhincodon typus TaxID=259920 RepID=UPI00202DC6E0|nr:polypeptide N-acetylgalactosaminyltransferase 4-like [Rhincodon typus]
MKITLKFKWVWLGKTCLLISFLWIAYVIIELSISTVQNSAGQSSREERKYRTYSNVEEAEDLSRPVYAKPDIDLSSPGELGKAVNLLLNADEKKKEEESVERYAINVYISDKISLHRHIKDDRMAECRARTFNYRKLPTTSVIIAFYNEAWSTLLRTIHSVLETSPAVLLKELILVDDYSDRSKEVNYV